MESVYCIDFAVMSMGSMCTRLVYLNSKSMTQTKRIHLTSVLIAMTS